MHCIALMPRDEPKRRRCPFAVPTPHYPLVSLSSSAVYSALLVPRVGPCCACRNRNSVPSPNFLVGRISRAHGTGDNPSFVELFLLSAPRCRLSCNRPVSGVGLCFETRYSSDWTSWIPNRRDCPMRGSPLKHGTLIIIRTDMRMVRTNYHVWKVF